MGGDGGEQHGGVDGGLLLSRRSSNWERADYFSPHLQEHLRECWSWRGHSFHFLFHSDVLLEVQEDRGEDQTLAGVAKETLL